MSRSSTAPRSRAADTRSGSADALAASCARASSLGGACVHGASAGSHAARTCTLAWQVRVRRGACATEHRTCRAALVRRCSRQLLPISVMPRARWPQFDDASLVNGLKVCSHWCGNSRVVSAHDTTCLVLPSPSFPCSHGFWGRRGDPLSTAFPCRRTFLSQIGGVSRAAVCLVVRKWQLRRCFARVSLVLLSLCWPSGSSTVLCALGVHEMERVPPLRPPRVPVKPPENKGPKISSSAPSAPRPS